MTENLPLLSGPILAKEELAELTGIPSDQIADAFDHDDATGVSDE